MSQNKDKLPLDPVMRPHAAAQGCEALSALQAANGPGSRSDKLLSDADAAGSVLAMDTQNFSKLNAHSDTESAANRNTLCANAQNRSSM